MRYTRINKLISLFFTTSRVIRERTESHDKVDPFSFLKLETLRYVVEKKAPTMKDIADYLCITPSSATSLIGGLVKEMKLKRVADKTDRRVVRLVITKKGKKIIDEGFKQVATRMKKILINLDEKEIDDFIKILEKLTAIYGKS